MSVDWPQVREEAIRILSAYIQIDTTNPPGRELAGARFLQGLLEREGLPAVVLETRPERGNVFSFLEGTEGLSPLILLHHIDVVPAETEKWRFPPLSGTVDQGEVWGRGAQDCKSLGVMELLALLLLKREGFRPRRRIVYLGTADEEAGGTWGVAWLFQNRPEVTAGEYVINEGGGVGLSLGKRNLYTCQTAEKGVFWLKITFRGRPGHGSVPHDDNCIFKMARAIQRISAYRSPIRPTRTAEKFIRGLAGELSFPRSLLLPRLLNPVLSPWVERRLHEPGLKALIGAILRNTFVPTVVQGGQKTNVIPSECSCQVDGRILPGVTPEEVLRELHTLLRGIEGYEIEVLQTSPPSESPADGPLYQALERSLRRQDGRSRLIPSLLSGATDSRYFREKGMVAYGFQPLSTAENLSEYLARVHGHDERISAESLLFGTRVLYDTLKDFCG